MTATVRPAGTTLEVVATVIALRSGTRPDAPAPAGALVRAAHDRPEVAGPRGSWGRNATYPDADVVDDATFIHVFHPVALK